MTSSTDKSEIDLGFAEECEPWLLANTYFPSKIGGRPAWLNLENIPMPDEMKCSQCNESLVFLCQVCPFDAGKYSMEVKFFQFYCDEGLCIAGSA